jgi:sugar phosphate isomerase/epimerase
VRKLSLNVDRLYKRYGAFKAGKLAKAAGFDAVDFSFMEMVRDDNEFLADNYVEIAKNIRAEFDLSGITVNQAHAPFSFPLDWFLRESELYDIVYPRLIRSMEMASILGAEAIIIHPIHYRDIGSHEAFRRNMEFYRYLMPYCEKFGIKVATENMWDRDPRRGHIIHDSCSTKEEFVRYIDEFNNPNFVACLDVGHVGLPRQDDEAHDFIYALGKNRLKALHIHDNNYRGDNHSMPFRGKINWEALGKALGEIGYEGDFTYELDEELISSVPDSVVPIVLKLFYEVLKYIFDVAESYRK